MTEKAKTKKQEAAEEQERCREELRRLIQPGDTLYTITNYSASGQTRWVAVWLFIQNRRAYAHEHNRPEQITDVSLSYTIARATGRKITDRGIQFGGWGYDADDDIRGSVEAITGLEPTTEPSGYSDHQIDTRKLQRA